MHFYRPGRNFVFDIFDLETRLNFTSNFINLNNSIRMKLYSYIIKHDAGLAPNPFWGELSLNVCKPQIRKTAEPGNWVLGTGSKNVKSQNGNVRDFSGKLVFAMKISKKFTMEEYDKYCKNNSNLKGKIPFHSKDDWRIIVGDSLYDFSDPKFIKLRKVIHDENDKSHDLSGVNTLLSNEFFYFGENAEDILGEFPELVKSQKSPRAHKIIRDEILIENFEKWIYGKFEKNRLYGEPQLKWMIANAALGKCQLECDS
jgi:Nucleotide modification associated domain 2